MAIERLVIVVGSQFDDRLPSELERRWQKVTWFGSEPTSLAEESYGCSASTRGCAYADANGQLSLPAMSAIGTDQQSGSKRRCGPKAVLRLASFRAISCRGGSRGQCAAQSSIVPEAEVGNVSRGVFETSATKSAVGCKTVDGRSTDWDRPACRPPQRRRRRRSDRNK
jgi:hypothetical protein